VPEEENKEEYALSNFNIRFIDIKLLLYDPRYIMHIANDSRNE